MIIGDFGVHRPFIGPHRRPDVEALGTLIKSFRKLPTGQQPFRQKPRCLKPGLYGERCILALKMEEARVPMPIFRYFAVVGSALLVLLFISDAYFDDGDLRFNGSLYESAFYAPRLDEVVATTELRFTRDVTPANRVTEVFAQFVPNENKRGKRYSSAATIIR